MDLRVLAQNHFAPRERRRVGDAASSDGDSDDEPEAAGEATGMRREDIVQLLFKSSLPLVLLVLLRNLMQYSVPIILYLGWIMIFHNLSRDFSSHLVFRNAEGSYALLREFLRSLLLMTMVFLVLDSDDFASSAILRLLYFSDVSVPRADVGLAVVLHSAICIDVIVRTVALSLKIGLNIVVPLLRKSSPWRKICTSTNAVVRRISNRYDVYYNDRFGVTGGIGNSTTNRTTDSSNLRRRNEGVDPASLEEGWGYNVETTPQSEHSSGSVSAVPADPSSANSQDLLDFVGLKRLNILYDAVLILYRNLIPVQIWINYFFSGPCSMLFCVMYVAIKTAGAIPKLRTVVKAAKHCALEKFEHGSYASEEQLASLSNCTCSICYDTFQRPMALTCSHIFCEHCIVEWFQREQSCPICRKSYTDTSVAEDSSGSTTYYALPVLI